ncbi:unnamed protein product [Citrullus colocynthis]|uniref:Uncharacterized protein n=1 Tax=Citrullus colocynthis TaxID=252529 RepID=A0ABP0YAY5_9ROSI
MSGRRRFSMKEREIISCQPLNPPARQDFATRQSGSRWMESKALESLDYSTLTAQEKRSEIVLSPSALFILRQFFRNEQIKGKRKKKQEKKKSAAAKSRGLQEGE